MGFLREHPGIEAWVQEHADAWRCLTDSEYKSLVSRWKSTFWHLIELERPTRTGTRAMLALDQHLPASLFLFGGVGVPRVANMGSSGACGYHVTQLRKLDRDLANRLELILVDDRLSYSCVFSHEASSMVWEHLYVSEGAA